MATHVHPVDVYELVSSQMTRALAGRERQGYAPRLLSTQDADGLADESEAECGTRGPYVPAVRGVAVGPGA